MKKYCVLPGHTPVRLDSTDGHIIIIGETPRAIPEQFILMAKAAGCLTEEELAALKGSLNGPPVENPFFGSPVQPEEPQNTTEPQATEESFPDPPQNKKARG